MTESNGRSDETKLAIEPRTMERHLSHTEQEQQAARPLRAASPQNGDDYLDIKKRRKRRRRRCCACCVVTLVVVVIIIVVLVLTVFKTKDPKINVSSVTLKGLSTAIDQTTLKVHLNVTVVAVMSIKNPNKASFKFGDSTASISYHGSAIGQAVIPAGKIKADKTVNMTVPVTIYTDVLLSNSNLFTDGISGSVPISVSTKLAGKVNLLHIIKKHVTIRSVCGVVIVFSKNTATADIQHCSNNVKM